MDSSNNTDLTDLLKVNPDKLIPYLKCSLCDGIFRTPYTINECMHTFCRACIYKYFYQEKNRNKCPQCLTSLGGKPLESICYDHSMHTLVNILFPEFEEIDKVNTEKMYEIFRENNVPLPGDPYITKNKKPNIPIVLIPFKVDNSNMILPKLDRYKITVQPHMELESLKKYIINKLDLQNVKIDIKDLIVYFKNQKLQNHYTIKDVDKIYHFGNKADDKIVFCYAREDR